MATPDPLGLDKATDLFGPVPYHPLPNNNSSQEGSPLSSSQKARKRIEGEKEEERRWRALHFLFRWRRPTLRIVNSAAVFHLTSLDLAMMPALANTSIGVTGSVPSKHLLTISQSNAIGSASLSLSTKSLLSPFSADVGHRLRLPHSFAQMGRGPPPSPSPSSTWWSTPSARRKQKSCMATS